MAMEQLQVNITAACPPAFGGTTGAMFAQAVTSVVAAHCMMFSDYQWPKDSAEDVIRQSQDGIGYDFIIVGAGTAGSLLAGRLAEILPAFSVLLIEAGEDPSLESEVPALLFTNQNTDFDWQYKTEPDGNSCLGFINNSCIWSKGKGLGGSSSINAMLYVRGHPDDYNKWGETSKNWSYEELLPYFEKIERELQLAEYSYPNNPLYEIIKLAWKEIGFEHYQNDNLEAIIGTRLTKLVTKNGKRLNSAKTYLKPFDNLKVLKNTIVQKVIIDSKTKIATGVAIKHANGKVMEINANKEVILSSGTVATPQILMLSGVGPKMHLKEQGINPIIDLSVGQNLQDHILLPLFLQMNQNTTITNEMMTLSLLQYMLTKSGLFSGVGIVDFMGFISTKSLNYPDVQFHHTYYAVGDNFTIKPYLEGIGYKKELVEVIQELNKGGDVLGIFPTLLHPKSKGQILLGDTNPTTKPTIKTNYFKNPNDMETLLKAIDFIHRLENTDTFKALGIKLNQLNIADCKEDDTKYWECYIRHMATTIYHPVGTAKMGTRDSSAVVNDKLQVYGVKNLRVVDASVIPNIPSGNTMAATLVVAAKAVDIISKKYDLKHNEEL